MRLATLLLAISLTGCTLNDVYHTGIDSLEAARITSSIRSDNASRFRLHPASSVAVQTPNSFSAPHWLSHAQAGVAQVFPSTPNPNYRLMVSWQLPKDVQAEKSRKKRLLDVNLGGLFEPPKISEVETLTVSLIDSSETLVHQERLTIKPALWRGDWDSEMSMQRAFYQFALDLAGR